MSNNDKEARQIFLKSYEEYIDLFISYDNLNEGVLLLFENNKYMIIPKNKIDNNIFDQLKGKKIGIFNFEGEYLFRTIGQKKGEEEMKDEYDKKRKEIIDFLKNI
jgi:hypothetical protein